jgi:Fic family protein
MWELMKASIDRSCAVRSKWSCRNVNAAIQRADSTTEQRSICSCHVAIFCGYEFVSIHPFTDGNGRMCRLLLNIAIRTRARHPILFRARYVVRSPTGQKHYIQCIKHSHNDHTSRLAFVVLCGFRDTAAQIDVSYKHIDIIYRM